MNKHEAEKEFARAAQLAEQGMHYDAEQVRASAEIDYERANGKPYSPLDDTPEAPPLSDYDHQAQAFLTSNGLRLRATLSDSKPAPWSATANHRHWRVTIWRDSKALWAHTGKPSRITFDFWSVEEPSDYTILACLSSEAFCPDSFDEFCSDLGYESDSRRALQTFRRSSAFAKRLQDFFTEHDLKELAEIR